MGLLAQIAHRPIKKNFLVRLFTLTFWKRLCLMWVTWRVKPTSTSIEGYRNADVILTQASGAVSKTEMGEGNNYIAHMALFYQKELRLPIMAQGEVEVEILRMKPDALLIGKGVIKLQTEVNPQGIYLDSLDVARMQFEECKKLGLTKPIVFTFSDAHMVRTVWATEDAGFKPKNILVPAIKNTWTPKCLQPWCRSIKAFIKRDIIGRPILLWLGRM